MNHFIWLAVANHTDFHSIFQDCSLIYIEVMGGQSEDSLTMEVIPYMPSKLC